MLNEANVLLEHSLDGFEGLEGMHSRDGGEGQGNVCGELHTV